MGEVDYESESYKKSLFRLFQSLRKCKTGGFDYGTVRRGTVTSASGRDGLYAAGTSAGRIYIFFR